MSDRARNWLIVGVVAMAAVVLIAGTVFIGWFFLDRNVEAGPAPFRGRAGTPFDLFTDDFQSNGERIFFTGRSETGPSVAAEMPGMHPMPSGMMTCAACHGSDGRGGTVRMMMATFTAPNIQYATLTSSEHGEEDGDHDDGEAGHEEHPPYTDETIKQAIAQGINPAGEELDWMMPRWNMTDDQLDDLIAFLKTLQ